MDYVIFKWAAIVKDPTGRYRVGFSAGTDHYGRWSDYDCERHLQMAHKGFPCGYERVDRERWEAARRGALDGYCDQASVDAPYDITPHVGYT